MSGAILSRIQWICVSRSDATTKAYSGRLSETSCWNRQPFILHLDLRRCRIDTLSTSSSSSHSVLRSTEDRRSQSNADRYSSQRCNVLTCLVSHHQSSQIGLNQAARINENTYTCHQTTVQFFTSPNVCFCTTWGKQTKHKTC